MRYLSQAKLPYATVLRAELTDGYRWHQAIWECFPKEPDAKRHFLFRVDQKPQSVRVLLLSETAPMQAAHFLWETKEVTSAFLDHAAYSFQVKANPTMRRSADKRRLAIYDEARLRAWIVRKASDGGFEINDESLVIGAPRENVFIKNGRRGKHVCVDFSGVLRVTNSTRFAQVFHSGIGSAKGFGYGLLMLQPIR